MTNPDTQLHAFRTFMGMPPDKSDAPACGAVLTDAYDFVGHKRPVCRKCAKLLTK